MRPIGNLDISFKLIFWSRNFLVLPDFFPSFQRFSLKTNNYSARDNWRPLYFRTRACANVMYIVPMCTKESHWTARWRCAPVNVKPEGEGGWKEFGLTTGIVRPVPRVRTFIAPYALGVGILIPRDQGLKGIWGSSLAPGWEFWPIILFRSWGIWIFYVKKCQIPHPVFPPHLALNIAFDRCITPAPQCGRHRTHARSFIPFFFSW